MTKKQNTKRTLVTNIIALVLCISMFVGSTFAWFTDSASTNVNKIEAGTLDIALTKDDGTGTFVNAEGETINFIKINEEGNPAGEIDPENVQWEPGAMFMFPTLRIENNGSLAAKFKLFIKAAEITKDLAEVIDVNVHMEDGYKTVGTLAELMEDTDGAAHGIIEANKTTKPYRISFKMQETAGNEYQGAKIDGISIIVVAGQAMSESDSYGNVYDKEAVYGWDGTASEELRKELGESTESTITISTAEELKAFADAVNIDGKTFAGKTIELANDIDLKWMPWTPIGQTANAEFKGVFDGKEHSIKNLNINNTSEEEHASTGLFGWIESHGDEGVTVKNLTIDGATVKGHHYVGAVVGYVYGTIENCHVINAKISNTAVNDKANGDKTGTIAGYVGEDATIKNCTAKDSTVSTGRDGGQIVGAAKESRVTGCSATNVTVTANGTSTGANVRNEVIGRILN